MSMYLQEHDLIILTAWHLKSRQPLPLLLIIIGALNHCNLHTMANTSCIVSPSDIGGMVSQNLLHTNWGWPWLYRYFQWCCMHSFRWKTSKERLLMSKPWTHAPSIQDVAPVASNGLYILCTAVKECILEKVKGLYAWWLIDCCCHCNRNTIYFIKLQVIGHHTCMS